jgi:hypothetical protein
MIRKLSLAIFLAAFAVALGIASSAPAYAQGRTEILTGDITRNKKLKKKITYILQGGVFVREGGTLRIKAGTTIVGQPGSFLVIDKGGRMIANGTAARPIIFTSAQPAGERARGDWGGIIFNGNAPVNCAGAAGGTCEGEGGTGLYGGSDAADNQGTMRYVRVEYGGFPLSPDNELNGVAWQGAGSGGTYEFIEALNGGDDGFEWFGGTSNAKNLVAVGSLDDSIDWTFGWIGKVQFALVQQRADGPTVGDRAIEADNNETNFEATPRSDPQLANFTLIGDPSTDFEGSTQGVELRRGTAGDLRNFLVMGFKREGVRISDESTYAQLAAGALDLQGFILFDNKAGDNLNDATATGLGDLAGKKILDQVDPQVANPFSKTAPDFRPAAGSPALDAANIAPKFDDEFFVEANYVGAFDGTTDWTAGWVSYASN